MLIGLTYLYLYVGTVTLIPDSYFLVPKYICAFHLPSYLWKYEATHGLFGKYMPISFGGGHYA